MGLARGRNVILLTADALGPAPMGSELATLSPFVGSLAAESLRHTTAGAAAAGRPCLEPVTRVAALALPGGGE